MSLAPNADQESDTSSVGSELKAQLAMASDPEIAELRYYIGINNDFGIHRKQLARHILLKQKDPHTANKNSKSKPAAQSC